MQLVVPGSKPWQLQGGNQSQQVPAYQHRMSVKADLHFFSYSFSNGVPLQVSESSSASLWQQHGLSHTGTEGPFVMTSEHLNNTEGSLLLGVTASTLCRAYLT